MPAPTKPIECQGCPLEFLGGPTWSQPEGRATIPVMIAAEALGENEQRDGLPLRPYAQAGSVLEATFKRSGLNREQFVLWNTVGCRPPNNFLVGAPYERGAIDHCRRHFDAVVEKFQPKAILAMGNTPFSALTGLAGEKLGVTWTRGFAFDSNRYPGVKVIPTYHPAYIARGNRNLMGVFRRDLFYAIKVAKEQVKPQTYNYKLFPEREAVEQFRNQLAANTHWPVWVDIETAESITGKDESELEKIDKITQIQFSTHAGHSIVMHWGYPYDELALQILALPNMKSGWNFWEFDLPHLRQHHAVVNGMIGDTMWKWKFWQPDIPRGLQFASGYALEGVEAWKHTSQSDPGVYGGHDTNYNLQVDQWIDKMLTSKGMMETYRRQILEMRRIHVRCAERGIPMNGEKLAALGEKLEGMRADRLAKMQEIVPRDLLNIEPKMGFVRDPEQTEGMVQRKFVVDLPVMEKCLGCQGTGRTVSLSGKPKEERVDCPKCDGRGVIEDETQVSGERECEECGGNGLVTRYSQKSKEKNCPDCKGKGQIKSKKVAPAEVTRWCRLVPFVPSGGENGQLLRYVKHKKHKVPTKRDRSTDEMKETTGKDDVLVLWKKTADPLYNLVLEYREYEKLIGTYIGPWMPDSGGFLRTHTYRYSAATGQLAAVNPNVLTAPKRGSVAKEWRACQEAKSGHLLVEVDMTAFHAKTLGFEARSLDYMRIAALDIHSFLTAHVLKVPEAERLFGMDDREMKEVLSWYKKQSKEFLPRTPGCPDGGWTFQNIRDFKSKPVVLGVGFGEGAQKIYDKDPDSYKSKAEAQSIKDVIKGLFPKIFAFQDEQVWEAYNNGFLMSKWRYIRWFWDAKRYDPARKALVNGEEAEAAMAFRPANDAHGMFKAIQLKLDCMGVMEHFGFFNPVHDALYFHPKEEEVEDCLRVVKGEMEKPCGELMSDDPEVRAAYPNGFQCGTEAKFGRNLKEMETWKG